MHASTPKPPENIGDPITHILLQHATLITTKNQLNLPKQGRSGKQCRMQHSGRSTSNVPDYTFNALIAPLHSKLPPNHERPHQKTCNHQTKAEGHQAH